MSEVATVRKFGCGGTQFVRYDTCTMPGVAVRVMREYSAYVEAADATEAAEKFHELTGLHPDHIDGRFVVGTCEACLRPIFVGEDFEVDGEGVHVCRECFGPAPEAG